MSNLIRKMLVGILIGAAIGAAHVAALVWLLGLAGL